MVKLKGELIKEFPGNCFLWVYRGNDSKLIRSHCPHCHDRYQCGDWCPLFYSKDDEIILNCATADFFIEIQNDAEEIEKINPNDNDNHIPAEPNPKAINLISCG